MLIVQKRDLYLHRDSKSYYTTPAHSKPHEMEATVQFSRSMHNCEEDLRVFWRNALCCVICYILLLLLRLAMIVFDFIVEQGIVVLSHH